MGGCVVSCMDSKNTKSMVPHAGVLAAQSFGPLTFEVAVSEGEFSAVYRAIDAKDQDWTALCKKLYAGDDGSLVALLETRCKEFGAKNAMGWRPIDKVEKTEIEENGKKKPWEFIHLKATQYLTFTQLWEKVVNFGKGLRVVGVQAGDCVGIYEETRMEWLVSCYGLWSQSMTGVTVYANLGEDALEYAIKEADLKVIICNGKAVKNLLKIYKKVGIASPIVIYTDTLPAELDVQGSTVIPWENVLTQGTATNEHSVALPKSADEIALIMYTSGTTGDPKGVVMTHGNTYAAVQCLNIRLSGYLGTATDTDAYVAYLPLAHILEFAAENVMLLRGSLLGYGNPRTLTDSAAKPQGDLKEFKPIFFAGVPRVFDSIKKVVESRVPDGVKGAVFNRAFQARKQALIDGKDTPYYNTEVFGNARTLLGGRCKAIVSGGAPLSAKTQEFMTVVFGCSVGQGYGLTETCACTTIQRFYDPLVENIGGLLTGVEIKLKDIDEWKHTDPQPRGEVCIRGPVVTKGYFKQPEKTAEAFKDDGWFHTGDVGMICPNGSLKIVGRVKALAKNAFGEYVALDALESTYVLNDLAIANGVCVLVDSHKAYICALVLTDDSKATKFAKSHNIAGTWPDFLKDPQFHVKAAESLAATAKANGKKPFECVKYVRVLNDEWTPENGVLTAAMKLKRRVVDVKYADLVKELFVE